MAELDKAVRKSDIVAEFIENAPWQRTTETTAVGEDADRPLPAWVAGKIQRLERAVRELEHWRSRVELCEPTMDGPSEPADKCERAEHAVAVNSSVPHEAPSVRRPVPQSATGLHVARTPSRKTACKLEQSIWDASLLVDRKRSCRERVYGDV